MRLSRREFLAGSGSLAGLGLMAPVVARTGAAWGAAAVDPAAALRHRLVVIYMQGGNDGLNTVIPMADVDGTQRYSVYRQVRPTIGYDVSAVRPTALDRPGDAGWALGLNPKLTTLHGLYKQNRVAVVQGVDYPEHNYSHVVSTDVWESGQPHLPNDSGWVGRHLDRAGIGDGELRAVGIGSELPLILRGRDRRGAGIASLPLRFGDGTGALGDDRHEALRQYGQATWSEPLRQFEADQAEVTVAAVETLETAGAPPATGNRLANSLLTARTLLEAPLGVEVVFVSQSGYDTHASQKLSQERLFTELDQALEAFLSGTMGGSPVGTIGPLDPTVAERTLIMTTSEFGRRIGENGGLAVAGTDHGAAAPLFLIGPGGAPVTSNLLVPGLHGEHPKMGTTLAPADNLSMTTELRRVYQAVLQQWLGDPEPAYVGSYEPLPGLFKARA